MSAIDDLYREVILDHHRHPAGRDPIDRIDVTAEGQNPSCGDEVTLELERESDRLIGVCLRGRGCAISTASGSILAGLIKGLHIEEARGLIEAFKELLETGQAPAELDLGDLEALAGVRQFPLRVKCAMLPWATLEQALAQLEEHHQGVVATTEEPSKEVHHV